MLFYVGAHIFQMFYQFKSECVTQKGANAGTRMTESSVRKTVELLNALRGITSKIICTK